MHKTILITGATDGIGRETAKALAGEGHTLLIHGRNPAKLEAVEEELKALPGAGDVESYGADLSRLAEVEALAKAVAEKHEKLDVLINNAGILKTPHTETVDGLDVRFAVNPGSLLGSKMVKEGFGLAGGDLGIGVDILMRAALSEEFAGAGGQYFDNDSGRFASPHPDGLDEAKCRAVVEAIEAAIARLA